MKIIKKAFFVLFTAGIFFLAGCASSPKNEKDAYYEENVKDFSKYELKNGIPVIFKKTNGGQVFVLRTVFEGGTPLVSPKMAGIEGLTLELMFHGSKNFSYEDIQNMQYGISFSMNSSSGRDYSVAGIKCLQKDLDAVLEIYADSINSPAFLENDFKVYTINALYSKMYKRNLRKTKTDKLDCISLSELFFTTDFREYIKPDDIYLNMNALSR